MLYFCDSTMESCDRSRPSSLPVPAGSTCLADSCAVQSQGQGGRHRLPSEYSPLSPSASRQGVASLQDTQAHPGAADMLLANVFTTHQAVYLCECECLSVCTQPCILCRRCHGTISVHDFRTQAVYRWLAGEPDFPFMTVSC